MKELTKEQVNRKYAGRYVEFLSRYDYSEKKHYYEIIKTHREIHENSTLGQDVGTSLEYTR